MCNVITRMCDAHVHVKARMGNSNIRMCDIKGKMSDAEMSICDIKVRMSGTKARECNAKVRRICKIKAIICD